MIHRATYLRDRLITINKTASEIVLENGFILKEVKENGIYREWGYASFDEAIEAMQAKGEVDYGPRNARNFIAIANMATMRGYQLEDMKDVPVSSLREIATVPFLEQQKALLEEAKAGAPVAEVQRKAKALRDKANGREGDPLHPITILVTESGRTLYKDCIRLARELCPFSDDVSETTVLLDGILADWHSNAVEVKAQRDADR